MTPMEAAFLQMLDMLESNGHLHWWQRKKISETMRAQPKPDATNDLLMCRVCGAKGAMGYVCPRADCPSAARVTS